jgi:hypothetical protein
MNLEMSSKGGKLNQLMNLFRAWNFRFLLLLAGLLLLVSGCGPV